MARLRRAEEGLATFMCPGCDSAHAVRIEGPHAWGFNGDFDKPTLTPSVLVRGGGVGGKPWGEPGVCHSFVRDGRIEFLGDCTHALAGRTVDLSDF
jgi:hypothetical protein